VVVQAVAPSVHEAPALQQARACCLAASNAIATPAAVLACSCSCAPIAGPVGEVRCQRAAEERLHPAQLVAGWLTGTSEGSNVSKQEWDGWSGGIRGW
jgi:hypothetical protein